MGDVEMLLKDPLVPPFEATHSIYTSSPSALPDKKPQLHLPAIYSRRKASGEQAGLVPLQIDDPLSLQTYFLQNLSVSRLNAIHKYLWLAGLARCARPLHDHILHNRKLVITERADYHLLWQSDTLYIMPLPTYLLDHSVWLSHLCQDRTLFELAQGMLLTYIWLVRTESDLDIAHDAGLLSNTVKWPEWIRLVRTSTDKLHLDGRQGVNRRYIHGELRLGRINWIYRFYGQPRTMTTLLRGYNYGYTTYGSFFERNTAWIITATVYITVVLTAMQVGLATKELQNSAAFDSVAYGFTIFSLVAPIGGVAIVLIWILFLVFFNFTFALTHKRAAALEAPSTHNAPQHQNMLAPSINSRASSSTSKTPVSSSRANV